METFRSYASADGDRARGAELPAGSARDEPTEERVRRELLEETDRLVTLGSLLTESGRLTSRAWLYFGPNARRVADPVSSSEEPLEVVLAMPAQLQAAIESCEFASAGHVAAKLSRCGPPPTMAS